MQHVARCGARILVGSGLPARQVSQGKQGGIGEEREEQGMVQFSLYFLDLFFLMKYIANRKSKLRTVFTFEILASRSSKLDPILIGFEILFFRTFNSSVIVLVVYT
jgi:hypothetical protein